MSIHHTRGHKCNVMSHFGNIDERRQPETISQMFGTLTKTESCLRHPISFSQLPNKKIPPHSHFSKPRNSL